jgi:hypothetical protein
VRVWDLPSSTRPVHDAIVAERPGRGRQSEQERRQAHTPAYSITSSARTRIDGGTLRLSALAVLAFNAISNRTGS